MNKKQISVIALIILTLCTYFSCERMPGGQDTGSQTTPAETTTEAVTTAEPVREITIVENGATAYRIVHKLGNTNGANAAKTLAKELKNALGIEFSVVTDSTPAEGKEILVGKTNRNTPLLDLQADGLEENGFFIRMLDNENIYIAGGGENGITYAVNRFVELFLGYDLSDQHAVVPTLTELKIPEKYEYRYTADALYQTPTPVYPEGVTVLYCLPTTANLTFRGTSFVIRTADGKLIVIDGDKGDEARYLIKVLKDLWGQKGVPEVEAWFISHMHTDHAGALIQIATEHRTEVKVKNVYVKLPSAAFQEKYEFTEYTNTFVGALNGFANMVTVEIGNKITVGSVNFDVMYTVTSELESAMMADKTLEAGWAINNSGLVVRMNTGGKSALFLGDLYIPGATYMMDRYGSALKSDVVAVAHHGQDRITTGFYQTIGADYAFINCSVTYWYDNSQVKNERNRLTALGAECLFPGYGIVTLQMTGAD